MIRRILFVTINVLFIFALNINAQPGSFVGGWLNTDSNTGGITRVRIARSGGGLSAHVWGKCTPTDCDWGQRPATRYYTGVGSSTVSGLTANYGADGITRFVIFKASRANTLQAQVLTRYTGGGRRNTMTTYSFRRAARRILATPVQVSPRNGARLTRFPRRTTLDWRPVAGASAYGVEVQYYSGGRWNSNYLSKRVSATQFTFNFVGDQPGRWRVWAIGSNNVAGRKSGWRRFSYSTTSAMLRAPALVSPANGQVFNRFPRTTTLNWNPVNGAVAYRVEIQYRSGGNWVGNYKNRRVTSSQFTFTFVGAQPGRWRVWAITRAGVEGRKSAWRTFRYTR